MVTLKRNIQILVSLLFISSVFIFISCQDSFLITDVLDGTDEENSTSEDASSNNENSSNEVLYEGTSTTLVFAANSQCILDLEEVSLASGDVVTITISATSDTTVAVTNGASLFCSIVDRGESGGGWSVISDYEVFYAPEISSGTVFATSFDVVITGDATSNNLALEIFSNTAAGAFTLSASIFTVTK